MLDQKIDSYESGSRPETEPKEPSQAGIHVLSDKEHSSHPLEDAHESPPQYHRVDRPRDYYLAQPPQSIFRMSDQYSPQYSTFYSRGACNLTVLSSPIVTKKAQRAKRDGKLGPQTDRDNSGGETIDLLPVRNCSFNTQIKKAPTSVRKEPPPPPYYTTQGSPYPYHDGYYSPTPYSQGQWQHPPPYTSYPHPYETSLYPPHPISSSVKNKRAPTQLLAPGRTQFVCNSTKKRPLPSQTKTDLDTSVPPRQKKQSSQKKKKMYSNFVGVTYNKTHAKYQSCITHYRKQHYLGRYKLACDAALAYDESAKLLKGKAWKVNFPTMPAYEQEREKEIHHIGRIGGNTADIDESETASIVAGKIAKIVAKLKLQREEEMGLIQRSKSEVTPCQVDHEEGSMPFASSESLPVKRQSNQSATNSVNIYKAIYTEKTSLTSSTDPASHTQGAYSSTPDSMIRPKILAYKRSDIKESGLNTTYKNPSAKPSKSDTRTNSSPPTINAQHLTSSKSNRNPVMKNGTLVAASALMTLFRNKDEPK